MKDPGQEEKMGEYVKGWLGGVYIIHGGGVGFEDCRRLQRVRKSYDLVEIEKSRNVEKAGRSRGEWLIREAHTSTAALSVKQQQLQRDTKARVSTRN